MPIYEYACGSCGHHFEARQKFSDDPISKCPECGQTVRRVFHPAGIIFKGSGFYINDSRSNGNNGKSSSSATSATSSTTSSTSSTPSSSESSTESKSEPVSAPTEPK